MADNKRKKQNHNHSSGHKRQPDFRRLSNSILLYANKGIQRLDFLRDASRMLLEFSGCNAVELWLKEKEKCFRCVVQKEREEPRILETRPLSSLKLQPVSESASLKSNQREFASDFQSVAVFPLRMGEEQIGLLRLWARDKDFFPTGYRESYESVALTLTGALAHRRAQVALRERVKELMCLYGLAHIIAQPEQKTEEMMQSIVKLLPPAWLYPEIASARITVDGLVYETPAFKEGSSVQISEIVAQRVRRGSVEVHYSAERPKHDEGPFLKEERNLIDAVARELALFIERREAEEEKSRVQEQLRHADRLATIGQLAAGVAHELNEPLGSILGFAQLAMKSPVLPPLVVEDLEKIVSASLHAREIVKKLLLVARQMPPRKTAVNLSRIVEEGLYFLESRCDKQDIKVVRSLDPDLPEIIADPTQLHQVLVNLVVNAIQAMPDGGRLTISTKFLDDQVALIVEDSGVGMEEKVLSQIFLPFFTTKDVNEGTGLGLPVVHGIVTSHGGTINVESRVGLFTRFEIMLPVGDSDIKEGD